MTKISNKIEMNILKQTKMNITDTYLKMEQLPDEVKRQIVRFIPRHDTAQIIHDSRYLLSLKYVRRYMFEENPLYEQRIWDELKPDHLRSIFYGDSQQIIRSQISKGQYIKLKIKGIII